jgi:phospholipid transport system substrate-binding protein
MFVPVQAAADTPNEFIGSIVDELAERMEGRRDELLDDPATLNALIDEVLLPRFDQEGFASSILREHWKTASEDQQTRFIAAFYSVLLHRYAKRLIDIKLGSVKILPFRGSTNRPVIVVKTQVDLVDGTDASLNYLLIPHETSWWIIDVKINGISYVTNLRTQFSKEIDKTSFDEFIVRLEAEASGDGGE